MATAGSPPRAETSAFSAAQLRSAVDQVLNSEGLVRAEQLRSFLRYVCECELAGTGDRITEYSIGCDALGRPADYDPGADATVRNRAHALRRKLDEIYSDELAQSPVRVELPKGSYRPRFVAMDPARPATAARRRLSMAAVFGAGVACTLVPAIFWSHRPAAPSPVDPVVRQVWGPLLDPAANVLVCIGTPPQLFVRPYPEGYAPPRVQLFDPAQDAGIYATYRQRHHLPPGTRLFAEATHNSPLWGDSVGAALTAQVLARAGVPHELWPERTASPIMLRGRNVILFGRDEYSEAAAMLNQQHPFVIRYDPVARRTALVNQQPAPGESAFYSGETFDDGRRDTFGLLSVMPSPGVPETQRRTILISGITSAGSQAAAEFFCSAESLRALLARFRKAGYQVPPRHYQVVVRTTSVATIPRTWEYVTHRVIER